MYLNLLFKSVKADAAVAVTTTTTDGAAGSEIVAERAERGERVKALIRRFLQVLVSGGGGAPEFIAGGLYLLGEVGVAIFFFPCFRVLLWFSSLLSIVSMSLLSLSSLFSRLLQIYRMLTFFFSYSFSAVYPAYGA